ncbi:MAG: CarD family transcriptional regulator, partial [Firmicutes bacterium]|nr:CarD family transcriptional regulator [Bacillota bacterium]
MYQIDDVVVYGLHGVCRITEIEEKEFAGESHLYYTMHPIFDNRSIFFVPVDNEKSKKKVRTLLSSDEIKELIHTMPQQEDIKVSDEKHRKEVYKT